MAEDWPGFRVDVIDGPDEKVIKLAGDLDMATAGRLTRAAEQLICAAQPLTVDLSGVAFCDSTGVNALIMVCKAHRETGGHFAVVHVQDNVRAVLEINGLLEYLGVAPAPTVGPMPS